MSKGISAYAKIIINAPQNKVWEALVSPEKIKEFMFGSDVVSEWKEGSFIIWKGVWEGKPYEDKGVIIQVKEPELLEYTHFSPLLGLPDVPENYHLLTYQLSAVEEGTELSLSQDNNTTEEQKEHSEKMWASMLEGIKKVVEND